MNDLISRQAAIDALDKEYRCTDRSDDWEGLKTAMLIIENLPSAQQTMGQQNDGDTISRQAAIDAINRLDIPEDMCVFEILSHIELEIGTLPSAQPEQQWIPCSERLPDEYDNYLVTKITRKAELEKGYKPHIWLCVKPYTQKSHWGKSTCGVIAWMPLPEPYKAESEDKE